MHLAEKFNNQIEDAAAMSSLVDSITEQCFKEEQFLNLAGRFFSYLAQNVKVETDGVTLRSLLLQKWVFMFWILFCGELLDSVPFDEIFEEKFRHFS